MLSADYQRYVDETFALARSLLIKSEAANAQINGFLEELGYTLPADPREWRYYKHLAGEYHFLDTPMTVRSLDTLTPIAFTKATLDAHPVTRDFYTLDSTYYQRLVSRFPEQEQLIRGILYPVAIDEAIDAPDYTILDYNTSLVQSNEINLIPHLQRRINHYYDRWNVPGYHEIDELFTVSHLGILYQQLPLMLFNIRLENCHTPYVHGFHIKEFLRSHNRLDRYYDYLTRKQHLFLYRNLRYIETHAGKQDTFDWLLARLLTERGVGLAEYTLQHDLRDLEEDTLPTLEFLRKGLNAFHRSVRSEEHSFLDLLEKEQPLTPGNARVQDTTLAIDTPRLINTQRNTYPTKALESSIVDTSTGGYITLAEVLMTHWIEWAFTGQYSGFLRLAHPQTGTLMDMSPLDALHLWVYCYNRAFGHRPETNLVIRPRMVRKAVNPSLTEMRDQVDMHVLSEDTLTFFHQQAPFTSSIRSPRYFHKAGVDMLQAINRQREVFSLEEDYRARGYAEGLFWSLYQTTEHTLWEGYDSVEEWLFEKGFGVGNLTQVEYQEFTTQLFQEATGLNYVDNHTMADIQQALVQLMAQLSSYSIQFIEEVNEGPIRFMDRLTIRLGDIDGNAAWRDAVPLPETGVVDVIARGVYRNPMDVTQWVDYDYHMQTRHAAKVPIGLDVVQQAKSSAHIEWPLNPTQYRVVEDEVS